MDFSAKDLKLQALYRSEALMGFDHIPVASKKIRDILGSELAFPEISQERPYIFSSFVNSVDGRLAFQDKPSAFYIAAKNEFAGHGAQADFWILNALRGVADAAIIGGHSMVTDADYVMTVLDPDLQTDRVKAGLKEHPLNIVMSLDCRDVPLQHSLFEQTEVPRMIMTSPEGLAYLQANMKIPLAILDEQQQYDLYQTGAKLPVFVCGKRSMPDSRVAMQYLRNQAIERLLIESPGYAHHLVRERMMDEFFLNRSGIYVGGHDTMVFGKHTKGFPADNHPHMKLLSLNLFNEFFTYGRYQFIYEGYVKEVTYE